MELFKGMNLLVRFLLELCMLAAVGFWGFQAQSAWPMKILLGIGLPVLIAVLWGLFIAPKATYPLHGPSRLAVELILLGSGAVALFWSDTAEFFLVFIGIFCVRFLSPKGC